MRTGPFNIDYFFFFRDAINDAIFIAEAIGIASGEIADKFFALIGILRKSVD